MTAFFFTSSGFGLFCTIFIVGWLIWAGMKSAGKCLDSAGQTKDMTWRQFKKEVGPMTRQEHIVSAVLIVLFIAFIIWIAEIT